MFLSLPSTALRSQLDINNLLNAFNKSLDAIISVTPSSRNPALIWLKLIKGMVNLIEKNKKVTRRQDAPKYFDITTVGYMLDQILY